MMTENKKKKRKGGKGKNMTKAICPRCRQEHLTDWAYSGSGTLRRMCNSCRAHIRRYMKGGML